MGLDGTLYDQVLDWIFALGLAPARFSVRTHPVPLDPGRSQLQPAGAVTHTKQ